MLTVRDIDRHAIEALLDDFGLTLCVEANDADITASFWGSPEAGIAGSTVYVRGDTPLHSLLHETSHVICMDPHRRAALHRDAGGDDIEEAAVCYLQIVLADRLPSVGRARLMQDMDDWGYSFRLGSTRRWFDDDAADARAWLLQQRVLADDGRVHLRENP